MKYVKYRTQKQQVSYDGGETWEDTGEIRKGEYLGVYDTAEDCANATVPPHETEPPQAHTGAKATFILDDGEEVDLPFTGLHCNKSDSGSSTALFVDDYAFTEFDASMSSILGLDWSDERKDYIAQHCVKLIISDQVQYVCWGLKRNFDQNSNAYVFTPTDSITFDPDWSVANDRRGYYKNLREIIIQDTTVYVGLNGHHTQVSRLRLPQTMEHLELTDFVYIDNELTIPESFTGGGWQHFVIQEYTTNTANKIVSYSNAFPDGGGYWDNYGCTPHTLLLYNESVPDSAITITDPKYNYMAVPYVGVPDYTYVRDELVSAWHSALVEGCRIMNNSRSHTTFPDEQRITEVSFFPLSIYNTDFRSPNDNEKFVARLSDGTLYSVPLGNGVVTSGDVADIQSRICDIKFGPGVTKLSNGVFSSYYTTGIITHNINLVEFNSDINVSECSVGTKIDKLKINGNNFFNSFSTALMMSPSSQNPLYNVPRYIFVPDEAFEAYVKMLPLKYTIPGFTADSTRTDSWRLKFRPMSSFKINE